jgi:hypothetical protein
MPDLADFSTANVDWMAFAGHIKAAAAEFAKGTPSPLDDLAVSYIADALIQLLIDKLEPRPVAFAAAPFGPQEIVSAAEALGVKLSPALVAILLQLAWPVVEALLKRWSKK